MSERKYEELRFSDDFMFCKVLQNDPELCRKLLIRLLGRKVGRLVTAERQHTIEITAQGRGVRFDVYAVDDESVIYDVEMQNANEGDLPQRARYAQAMIDLEQLDRAQAFGTLNRSIVIFICRFNLFPKVGLHRYVFQDRCAALPELELGDGAEKVFICTRGRARDVTEEEKRMLEYMENGQPSDELTNEVDAAVSQAHFNPRWRMEYHDLQRIIEREKDELRAEICELEAEKRGWQEEKRGYEEEIERLRSMLKAYTPDV